MGPGSNPSRRGVDIIWLAPPAAVDPISPSRNSQSTIEGGPLRALRIEWNRVSPFLLAHFDRELQILDSSSIERVLGTEFFCFFLPSFYRFATQSSKRHLRCLAREQLKWRLFWTEASPDMAHRRANTPHLHANHLHANHLRASVLFFRATSLSAHLHANNFHTTGGFPIVFFFSWSLWLDLFPSKNRYWKIKTEWKGHTRRGSERAKDPRYGRLVAN